MSDVVCPYCKTEQEINHDDGYGYDEDLDHTQHCVSCRKEFTFTTEITYSYEVCCIGGHELEQPVEIRPDFFMCINCDHSELRRD